MISAQEIVNQVWDWFIVKGNPKSVRMNGGCGYRAGNLRCAVGCLIRDDEYQPEMEGKGVNSLLNMGLLPRRLQRHARLLGELQCWHDTNIFIDRDVLVDIIKEHGLEVPGEAEQN